MEFFFGMWRLEGGYRGYRELYPEPGRKESILLRNMIVYSRKQCIVLMWPVTISVCSIQSMNG